MSGVLVPFYPMKTYTRIAVALLGLTSALSRRQSELLPPRHLSDQHLRGPSLKAAVQPRVRRSRKHSLSSLHQRIEHQQSTRWIEKRAARSLTTFGNLATACSSIRLRITTLGCSLRHFPRRSPPPLLTCCRRWKRGSRQHLREMQRQRPWKLILMRLMHFAKKFCRRTTRWRI